MNKSKVAGIMAGGIIASMLLTGCSVDEKSLLAEKKKAPEAPKVAQTEQLIETKVFAPAEHVIYKRYRTAKNGSTDEVYGGQIEVPKGYEILDIENWTSESFRTAYTGGFDVWFVNVETVEATGVYNEAMGYYDYSEPGKVIEQELEEEGPTLKKVNH